MITDVLIDMQDTFNNTFDDSDYEKFVAETQGVTPGGATVELCSVCGEYKPARAHDYRTAEHKLKLRACRDCSGSFKVSPEINLHTGETAGHSIGYPRLSDTVQSWKDKLDKHGK